MSRRTPPDQGARDRAEGEIDLNLLIEAGAGSGKTTLLARRVVALLTAGRPANRIAAVTFTKKAAGELRERVQIVLESAGADASIANDVFVGTIHSFCARALRDRPIEAGLDPHFRELDEDDAALLAAQWWADWIERLHVAGDRSLAELRNIGIEPWMLADGFREFVQYPDVDFSAPPAPMPDTEVARRSLEQLIDDGMRLMPEAEPEGGWDPLQRWIQQLDFARNSADWADPTAFFEIVADLPEELKPVQKRWVRSAATDRSDKADAKALAEEYGRWREGDGARAIRGWREHRYAPIADFLRRAANAYASYRITSGRLSFEDLLLHTRDLLRRDVGARAALGERWRYLLVDEFQDTDPLQAEILFLLGSAPTGAETEPEWWQARLRPGALFVVGDPKQSIYRFRRADIETYEQAKAAFDREGAVLALTANFRSRDAIASLVNTHFGALGAFPAVASEGQAAFAMLEPARDEHEGGRVARYEIRGGNGSSKKDDVNLADAEAVASWIATLVARGEAEPHQFLVMTRKKDALAGIARQLSARGIPVAVSGADVTLEHELHELLLLLRALQDPANPVLVAAVLEGRLFGMSPADLWAARQARIEFTIVTPHRDPSADPRAEGVRGALLQLHAWLLRSRDDAPDVFLSRVLDETGMLAFTAADELGDVRAGLLVRLLEEVRIASLDPDLTGMAALQALEGMLKADIPDAPLLPGRTDAVRVMNLHKAKGLEGDIVILASPTERRPWPPRIAVRRVGGGAVGGVLIQVERNQFQRTILAQPPGWEEMAAAESARESAEHERLRYVAATRAESQLVVGEFVKVLKGGPTKPEDREWSAFAPVLDRLGAESLAMPVGGAGGRERLARSASSLDAERRRVEANREAAATRSWTRTTVTQSAKASSMERRELEETSAEGKSAGAAWGRAVHRVIEEVGRAGDAHPLAAAAARIATEEAIPERAPELEAVVARLQRTDAWQTLRASPTPHFEWPVSGWSDGAVPEYVEGVIDAAYRTADGWHIVDWKSDDVSDAEWENRRLAYERQLALYASLLRRATGGIVTAALVRVR